ncbi:hypothetical protein [Streptomyces flaveolus]|uniref:hypothetical protein n=1 Tax=Streptomyces flaveolus TaxID=67297 RepID=UPI0033F8C1DC
MVTDAQTLELFRFTDAVQSATVEETCDAPWTQGDERHYRAEIIVQSDFVNGRASEGHLRAPRKHIERITVGSEGQDLAAAYQGGAISARLRPADGLGS